MSNDDSIREGICHYGSGSSRIEGPGWLTRDFDRLWNDPQQRERVLVAVTKVEHEPSVLGASSHIMAIARK